MAAAPWCRRHTSCGCTRLSRRRGCPCSSRTVVDLARPRTAVSLARTATCSACRRLRGSLGLDHSRDRQKNDPTRARALLRAWVRMNGEVEGALPRAGLAGPRQARPTGDGIWRRQVTRQIEEIPMKGAVAANQDVMEV